MNNEISRAGLTWTARNRARWRRIASYTPRSERKLLFDFSGVLGNLQGKVQLQGQSSQSVTGHKFDSEPDHVRAKFFNFSDLLVMFQGTYNCKPWSVTVLNQWWI